MYRRLALTVLAVALATVVIGCQGPSPDALLMTPPAPTPPRLGPRGHFPPGERVFLNHRGTIERIEEPDFHMRLARRAFARGRFTLAAHEVERVRGGVRWFEDRAAGERRKRLIQSQRALRMLERQLRRREVDSIRVLDGVFKETLLAIAGRKPRKVDEAGSEAD